MNPMTFLIETIFDLYLLVVILRFWLQLVHADFYNPLSQFVVKLTNPILAPMRKIIPSPARIDTPSIILAILIPFIKWIIIISIVGTGIPWLTIFIFAVLTVIKKAGMLLTWILIIRAVLSWVSQGRNPIEYLFHQLSMPFLAPIQRIIPPIAGIDLSLMVLLLLLQFINMLLGSHINGWWQL